MATVHSYRTTGLRLRCARMKAFAEVRGLEVQQLVDADGFVWSASTILSDGAKVLLQHDNPAVAQVADNAFDDLSEAALLASWCALQRAESFASAVNDLRGQLNL